MPDISDEDLFRQVQQGDLDALESLYARYRRPLASFIYQMVRDYDRAGDLLHDAIIRVYESRDRYEYPKRVSAWIFRIARNLCLDFLRSAGHRKMRSLDARSENGDRAMPEKIDSGEYSPAEIASVREMDALLTEAMEKLPAEVHEAIVMRVQLGLRPEDIAEILDVHSRTVRRWIAIGLESLRQAVDTS